MNINHLKMFSYLQTRRLWVKLSLTGTDCLHKTFDGIFFLFDLRTILTTVMFIHLIFNVRAICNLNVTYSYL